MVGWDSTEVITRSPSQVLGWSQSAEAILF